MEYSMRWVRGHIEVYDGAGRFLFSADSEWEAERELESSAGQKGDLLLFTALTVERGRSLFDAGRGSSETPPLLWRTCTNIPLPV